jgi:Mg/Co/Ni transporter MgtE
MAENLSQLHPADLANIVEDLDVMQGSNLLSSLDEREAAKVFEELDPHWQTILVKYLGPEKASRILSQVSVDELVDLAKTFTTREARKFLSKIKPGQAQAVQKLLAYPDNTAGGLMTLDFLTARPEWTVARTIEEVKQASDSLRSIVYIYVTDQNGKFVGVVSLRRLLTGDPGAVITKVAKPLADYATLRPDDKMDKIIELMTRYNLYTAAVLDSDKKLAGVVTIDDVMRQLYPAA